MKIVKVSLAVLLLAGMALAQQGAAGRGQMRAQPAGALKDYLKLTDDQIASIRAVRAATRETLNPMAQQLKQKSQALREALKADPIDSNAVSGLRKEIAALRDQIKAARTEAGTKTRSVLDATQLGLLAELEKVLTLQAAAHQAVGLNLLEPPERIRVPGQGMGAAVGMRARARARAAAGAPAPAPRKPNI